MKKTTAKMHKHDGVEHTHEIKPVEEGILREKVLWLVPDSNDGKVYVVRNSNLEEFDKLTESNKMFQSFNVWFPAQKDEKGQIVRDEMDVPMRINMNKITSAQDRFLDEIKQG